MCGMYRDFGYSVLQIWDLLIMYLQCKQDKAPLGDVFAFSLMLVSLVTLGVTRTQPTCTTQEIFVEALT